jgi:hypothetical protein
MMLSTFRRTIPTAQHFQLYRLLAALFASILHSTWASTTIFSGVYHPMSLSSSLTVPHHIRASQLHRNQLLALRHTVRGGGLQDVGIITMESTLGGRPRAQGAPPLLHSLLVDRDGRTARKCLLCKSKNNITLRSTSPLTRSTFQPTVTFWGEPTISFYFPNSPTNRSSRKATPWRFRHK